MPGHDNKICTLCNLEKHKNLFSKNKKHPDGLSYWCKSCNAEKSKNWRLSNPEKKIRANRQKGLKGRYGLTIDQYNFILNSQNHVCAVCQQPETAKANDGNIKHLAVDHDHETGKVRGLLCDACNRAEGYLKSDPEVIRRLADYVEKNSLV